jgi:hypothetical protein
VSDDMMMSGEEPIVPEGTVAPLPAPPMIKPGTAKRNMLLILAGVIVLVALVGFVAYAMMIAGSATAPGAGTPAVTPGTPTASTSATTPTAVLPDIPAGDNRDIFTPRNPFEPIAAVKLKVVVTPSADGTGTSNQADTLSLVSIDASATPISAVVRLNGVTQAPVHVGDMVGSSPWHVDAITDTSLWATNNDFPDQGSVEFPLP